MPAVKKVSSRSERLQAEHERKLIVRITLLSTLGLGFILALVIWGIPAFISVSTFWLNVRDSDEPAVGTGPVENVTTPTLGRFTDQVTKRDTIDVTAYANEGSTVILERNGAQVAENVADSSGNVSFNGVSLTEGNNDFVAFIVGKEGKRSEASNTVSIVRDTQPPTIAVDKPFSGETFRGQSQRLVEVTGKANEAEVVFVQDTRVILGLDGGFSQRVRLEPGENNLTIYALDEAGNESVKVVRVVRWEE